MILTLEAKRRLTVPAGLAPAQPGDHFIAEFNAEEDVIVFPPYGEERGLARSPPAA